MINEVVAKLVIKILLTISGKPDYESLNDIIQALYTNITTLMTTLTGDKHDLIGLIMKDNMYITLVTGTTREYPKDSRSMPTITDKATVSHGKNANKKHIKAHQFFERFATMNEFLKHRVIEIIEYTYIAEHYNKYKGFMGVKIIDMVHHLMYIYGKITEIDLK